MQLRVDLMDHPRFLDLLALLDDVEPLADLPPGVVEPLVLGCLAKLWSSTMARQNIDGDLTGLSAAAIAGASKWPFPRSREQWLSALTGSGFLERSDDGRLLIRHWTEFSGKFFVNREKARTRMATLRSERSANVPSTFAEHSPDVPADPGVCAEQDANVLRAKILRTGELKTGEDVLTDLPASAHARTREAEPEDDFLASLDDPVELPGSNGVVPESAAHPFAEQAEPGVVVTLPTPGERGKRRERPASGEELEELRRSWGRRFAEIGAADRFDEAWRTARERTPNASARWLNDQFFNDRWEREKAWRVQPAAAPMSNDEAWFRQMRAETIEALQSQGMPIPAYLTAAS